MAVRKARFSKGRDATSKIFGFGRTCRQASKLFHPNAYAKAMWAPEIHGVSPSMLKGLRSMARAASKTPQRGVCATTAIRLTYGHGQDPLQVYVRRVVKSWFARLAGRPGLHRRLARHWAASLAKIRNGWAWVRGPMAAFQATIMAVGWQCPSPFTLIAPCGDEWQMMEDGHGPLGPLLEAFDESIDTLQWRQASEHLDGGGIQGPISLHHVWDLVASLDKEGRRDLAAMIRLLVSGGYWTEESRHTAQMAPDPVCRRCQRDPETSRHRFWDCMCNASSQVQEIVDSQHLRHGAQQEAAQYPCFWMRGLIPLSWFDLPPVPGSRDLQGRRCPGALSPGCLPGGLYATDGTGGQFAKFPVLRRVAFAFVRLRPSDDFDWDCGVTGVLDSVRQTVPRAELAAIVECLRCVDPAQDLRVVTDHANIVKGFLAGRAASARLANFDLWWEFWQLLSERTGDFQLSHVPSHLLDDSQKLARFGDSVDWDHVVLNSVADELADLRARECQVPHSVVQTYNELVANACSILKRNASIILECAALKAEPERRLRKQPIDLVLRRRRWIEADVRGSSHVWEFGSGFWTCGMCKSSISDVAPALRARLRSACPASGGGGVGGSDSVEAEEVTVKKWARPGRPLPARDDSLWRSLRLDPLPERAAPWVAGKAVHPSHVLWQKGAFTFCGECGSWAIARPDSLREPCPVAALGPHAITKHQLEVLQRVCKGLPPSKTLKSWVP